MKPPLSLGSIITSLTLFLVAVELQSLIGGINVWRSDDDSWTHSILEQPWWSGDYDSDYIDDENHNTYDASYPRLYNHLIMDNHRSSSPSEDYRNPTTNTVISYHRNPTTNTVTSYHRNPTTNTVNSHDRGHKENSSVPNLPNSIQPLECPICRLEIDVETIKENGNPMLLTNCGHIFHQQCISSWYESDNYNNKNCPVCRKKIT